MRRALLILLLLMVPAVPAAADSPPRAAIHLASQTPWLGPSVDAAIGVTVTGTDPAAPLDVVVNVFPAVGSRSEFQRTLTDHIRGPQVRGGVFSSPLAALPVDAATGTSVFTVPLAEHAILSRTGVYPVRVELRERGGKVLDHFDTHFLFVTAAPESSKLGVSLVLPFHAPPAYQADATVKLDPKAVAALSAYATALADPARTGVPIVVRPTPETVAALAASPRPADHQPLAQLAAAVAPGRGQLVGGSWVPVDVSAFIDNGLPSELDAQLTAGDAALKADVPVDPGASTWMADDWLSPAGVSALADRGISRMIVPDTFLAPVPGQQLTLSQPFQLEGRPGRRVPAVAADSGLTGHFANSEPVLNAHQLLADLAVLYLDAPAQRRGVAVVASRSWSPDPVFVATVFQGLATSPLVAPMSLDDLFAVPPATVRRQPMVRSPAKANPSDPASLPAATIRDTRRRLDSFRTLLPATVTVGDEYDRALLTGESDDLRAKQRTSQVTTIQKRIGEQLKLIHLPGNRSITLTARKGQIPVTVENEAPFPVHIRLLLRSDKLKLAGGVRTMDLDLTRRVTTVPVTVETRTSGTFPLRITLLSPDGQVTLGTSRITIRSTATSGVGIILSLVAGLVLVTWWVRNIRHGRRDRQLVPA